MPEVPCGYCGAPAVDTIPATPEHVCRRDAEAFWQGLLAEARRSRVAEDEASQRRAEQEPAAASTPETAR